MQTIKTEKPMEVRNMTVSSLPIHQQSAGSPDSATNVKRDAWMKTEMGGEFEAGVKSFKTSTLQKPHLSYIALISRAIQSSPHKRMLLSDIYEWIVNNFSSFKMTNRSWRNSVRHNLSLNECFIKCGRCDSGKGHYWGIHPANREDFAKGDYRRRHARRLVKKCDELAKLFESDSPNEVAQNPSVSMTSQYGYVRMTCTMVSNSYLIANFGSEVLSADGRRPQHFNENFTQGRSDGNRRVYVEYPRSGRQHSNDGISLIMSEKNK